MPAVIRVLPALAGAVLFLAACGTEKAAPGAERTEGAQKLPVSAESLCPGDFALGRFGAASASPAPAPTPSGTPRSLPVPSAGGPGEDGLKITGLYAWGAGSECASADYSAAFELTNQGTEKATYTVTFGFLSASGGSVDNVERTVEAVAPGATVKDVVAMSAMAAAHPPEVTGVQVIKVRSVPAAEASSASGPCPASGVHVYADQGDAAMGLRVVGLHLVNCGTDTYQLNGYPGLELLDEDHEKVDGVRILHGTDAISPAAGGDGSPRPLTLRPGQSARTTLAWRNTTQAGDPVNAPYVRVRPKPGAAPVTVVPELDLGTTGKLGVGPWEMDESSSG
ncbi:DUF4232 domain-containing protein [Streptomyces justiciae]|uniref:DUF4232 domain-containing protein n=1 Tax=Streptomyces justiciae TaxID=2780140 RepID=A0ABU3LU70_9ACTN|nr:DUF4232 domain-containing protein [Streptomyces justiciae]MDT7842790.1 DUF4232 domain-containing protein [Streptomyces justiciae]